jgi:hypothetical protein
MKSSPFKLFSLSAREADQRGNYANPELGRYKATTFDHPDLSGIENKKAKPTPEDMGYDGTKPSIKPKGLSVNPSKITPVDISTNITREQKIIRTKDTPKVTENQAWNRRNKVIYPEGSRDQFNKDMRGSSLYGTSGSKGGSILKERTIATIGRTNVTGNWKESNISDSEDNKIAYNGSSVSQMKGSPVKHNAGAVGSIGNADPLAGGIAGIGQQISNQAQQRAVDAGGSTGVDPFLPPPNQVAETGSYGSGGDRDMLEMNGNQINNQSIGRNTDITSQLFGSGQRASMLAMKGTPLHTEGHGGAKDHKHSPESRNPATPKYINGVDPYETADKSISSTDEPRRLEEGEIGAPTEREQSDRDYLAEFDMEYKASGGNLYVPKKR